MTVTHTCTIQISISSFQHNPALTALAPSLPPPFRPHARNRPNSPIATTMTVLSSSFFCFYPQAALVELTQDSNPNDAEQRAQLVAAEAAYTSALGFETQHCSLAARQWWNAQIEAEGEIAISREEQQRLLDLVVQSEVWDAFMQRKVPAVKLCDNSRCRGSTK